MRLGNRSERESKMLYSPEWDKSNVINLDTPSLKGLIHVLRNKHLWPPNFKWYYGFCNQCAMGLASELWSKYVPDPNLDQMFISVTAESYASRVGRVFGLDPVQSVVAFYGSGWVPMKNGQRDFYSITPEMVADKLEQYL